MQGGHTPFEEMTLNRGERVRSRDGLTELEGNRGSAIRCRPTVIAYIFNRAYNLLHPIPPGRHQCLDDSLVPRLALYGTAHNEKLLHAQERFLLPPLKHHAVGEERRK